MVVEELPLVLLLLPADATPEAVLAAAAPTPAVPFDCVLLPLVLCDVPLLLLDEVFLAAVCEVLCEEGFFEGLIFHRVIKGFMIQGGGYTEEMEHKETESIKGEFKANGFMQNDLKHTRGVLSMARTSDPDSASSQFFVMHKDAPHLDAQYAGFGKLTDGFDVLDAIADTKTGSYGWYMQDVPRSPIVIEKVEVISK